MGTLRFRAFSVNVSVYREYKEWLFSSPHEVEGLMWSPSRRRRRADKKKGPGPFSLTVNCYINYIGMHDASGDANYNACFGCWLWPRFYGWTTWLRKKGQVHSRLLPTATSTLLVCMMHLGMLTTMHTSDAGSDLDFTVEWLGQKEWARSIPTYCQLLHQLYCYAWCIWGC